MKKINKSSQYILYILLLISTYVFSQDKIYLKSGESLETIILEVNIEDIKYKKFTHQEGPTYTVLKSDVHMILYKNGESEMFKNNYTNNSASLESVKSIIITNINKFGSSINGNNPFVASFENNYLRIRETNRSGTSYIYDLGLFDFTMVYKFDGISYRSYDKAYINIWVLNKRKQNWRKTKLVIGIMGHDNAKKTYSALQKYSALLTNLKE